MSGIRLHTGEWTVDQAAAFFEARAHLPAPAARREAERGTYDPTYGGYFLGKMAALKLREDVRAKEGAAFDLRRFQERVMTNGIAAMVGAPADAVTRRHLFRAASSSVMPSTAKTLAILPGTRRFESCSGESSRKCATTRTWSAS
ncbi:MAG: DUF885 family protein [Vicinamibacterales bacterium]